MSTNPTSTSTKKPFNVLRVAEIMGELLTLGLAIQAGGRDADVDRNAVLALAHEYEEMTGKPLEAFAALNVVADIAQAHIDSHTTYDLESDHATQPGGTTEEPQSKP